MDIALVMFQVLRWLQLDLASLCSTLKCFSAGKQVDSGNLTEDLGCQEVWRECGKILFAWNIITSSYRLDVKTQSIVLQVCADWILSLMKAVFSEQ